MQARLYLDFAQELTLYSELIGGPIRQAAIKCYSSQSTSET
jgi:hypothetical protein